MVDNSNKAASKELYPTVLWSQTKDCLFITVEIVKADDYHLDVTEDSLKFKGVKDSKNYKFELSFYKPVKSNEVKQSSQRNIKIKLPKVEEERWPTLNNDGKKHWLKCDWDRWVDSDDESGKPNGFDDFDMDNFDMGNFGEMDNLDGSDEEVDEEDEEEGSTGHACCENNACSH